MTILPDTYRAARALALVPLLLLLPVACQPNYKVPAMTSEETQVIETLTAHMAPRCVGRYLIDLPVDFVLNPITTTKLEGVDITITRMERGRFNDEFLAQRATLTATMLPGKDKQRPHLRKEIALPDGAAGGVFDRSETAVSSDRMGRMLELVAWRNGFRIVATIKATDTTFPEDADDSIAKQLKTDVPEKLAHLLNVYERVRGRGDHEVPTEQGLCFANGFLSGEPNDEDSQIDLYYHLRTAKDVYFTFHSLSDLIQDDTLLDRGPAIEKMLKARNGETLRKGKRESHGLKFEEWLMTMESDPGGKDHNMTLEVNSKTASPLTPLFIVDLDSGVEHPGPELTLEQAAVHKPLTKATFSAAQTVALWDKATATLRPRPITAQAAPATAPVSATLSAPQTATPRLPLGTSLASGTRCPQSGTWQCAAANAVGGARRSFTAGETLSSVLAPVERSFLQRLKGAPQNALTGTVWTLVAYPDSNEPG